MRTNNGEAQANSSRTAERISRHEPPQHGLDAPSWRLVMQIHCSLGVQLRQPSESMLIQTEQTICSHRPVKIRTTAWSLDNHSSHRALTKQSGSLPRQTGQTIVIAIRMKILLPYTFQTAHYNLRYTSWKISGSPILISACATTSLPCLPAS